MIKSFGDFGEFKAEARKLGYPKDLTELTRHEIKFLEKYDNFTVINLHDYGRGNNNNLMVLTAGKSLLYSEKKIGAGDLRLYKSVLGKKFGESTAFALVATHRVLENYEDYFEKISDDIDGLEENLDIGRIQHNAKVLRKLHDKVEEFVDVVLELKERKVREVKTEYLTYDFDLLVAKANHLLNRAKSHLSQLNNLRTEYEIRSTNELNKQIKFLTLVMKNLTALTVILTVPMLIASWYGMNFKFMPELSWQTGYSAALFGTVLVTALTFVAFRLKKWI
ncbi:magnesium transporter CorA family protein [Candidatus Micrarchaeota archaeon]|nr:magnesium transporter CorA family protein [Candidatus Micrarchaeota archaeon]